VSLNSQLASMPGKNAPPTQDSREARSSPSGVIPVNGSGSDQSSMNHGDSQYYFREPRQMVGGFVAPPRIDIRNRELVRSAIFAKLRDPAIPPCMMSDPSDMPMIWSDYYPADSNEPVTRIQYNNIRRSRCKPARAASPARCPRVAQREFARWRRCVMNKRNIQHRTLNIENGLGVSVRNISAFDVQISMFPLPAINDLKFAFRQLLKNLGLTGRGRG
jgi:hypothetical protein